MYNGSTKTWTSALETFKTLSYLNQAFMKNLFAKQVLKRRKKNFEIPNQNTVKYRDKSIRSLGPHVWNGLPEDMKNENPYDKLKST